jgi:hypothetical protein
LAAAADDVVVQVGLDLGGVGTSSPDALTRFEAGQLVADDVVAQVDALVADEHRRTGDQLLDLVLALAAERAVERFFTGGGFFVGHRSGGSDEAVTTMIVQAP